jgi:hypothetical protein
MSGGGEGVYLGESLTEEKGSFGGRTRRLPKVVVEMEREGGEERKKGEEEERVWPNRYTPKGASLGGPQL